MLLMLARVGQRFGTEQKKNHPKQHTEFQLISPNNTDGLTCFPTAVIRRKRVYLASTSQSSPSVRKAGAETEAQPVEEHFLLACFLHLTQLAIVYNSGPLPMGSTAHRDPGTPTSITSENAPQTCLQASVREANFSIGISSQMTMLH